jgi:hypothetical protein
MFNSDYPGKGEKMNRRLFLAVLTLVLASMACQAAQFGSSAPESASPVPAKNTLYSDDFSSSSSGWDQHDGTDGVTAYADGGYRIFVNQPNYLFWANPSKSFSEDLVIDVDATKSAGPEDNEFGVICGYQDAQNFYIFKISSDGYAQIAKYANDEYVPLSGDQMDQVSGIKSGESTNHLQAKCIGDSLTLLVNGKEVLTATDSGQKWGDVGLYAGTFDTAGTDILFDNFVVSKP